MRIPLFGLEERPVPQSDVPGEATWPTQPFPVQPPPLARTTFDEAKDFYALTPEAHATPMTFMGRDLRQYVVIAAGGNGLLQSQPGSKIVAFALPVTPPP